MNVRIRHAVAKCLLVLLRPQVMDGGSHFMEIGCQVMQVGAQDSECGGITDRRADI